MSKRIHQILAATTAVCVLSASTVAQQQIDVTVSTLLTYSEFVKVLELTPKQMTDLHKIREEETVARYQIFGVPRGSSLQGSSLPQRGTGRTEEEVQRLETLKIEMLAKVDKRLTPKQRTKLRDITFQLAGGWDSSVLKERTLEALNMTDAQKTQIQKILKERDAEMKVIQNNFEMSLRDREAYEKRATEGKKVRAKYTDQVKSLLTAEQKAKAEKLIAEMPALREKLGLPLLGQPRAPKIVPVTGE